MEKNIFLLTKNYPMKEEIRINEGFKGERLVSLPEILLARYCSDPVIGNLYPRKIGYSPSAKFHYVRKENGCNYNMLIYCVDGKGWCEIGGKMQYLCKGQFIALPQDTPYSFGADNEDPWTIYWVHFRGNIARQLTRSLEGTRKDIRWHSSRIDLFEETYKAFSMGYIKEYMAYSSFLLGHFLASFIYPEQFIGTRLPEHESDNISGKAIGYMHENLHKNMTLQELADKLGYSPSHFSNLFRQQTGESPIAYFLKLKIQKSCQYVELTNMKMNEISDLMGIDEPAYFTRLFTKIMGITPSEYRKRERKTTFDFHP